jgi:glycosyltransferase involved in cell wall biosynthesis
MTDRNLEFELVLPCYNESQSLEKLIRRAKEAAEASNYSSNQFKLVLVENGSKDHSRQVLSDLEKSELGRWFRVVLVDVNQGYGFGLASGLKTTTARFIGWSHADQQCDPKDAFLALSRIKISRHEKLLVKGVRSGRNWKDRVVSRVFEAFAWIFLGMKLYEINAQPKVFPRVLWNEIKNPPLNFAFDLYVLYRATKASYRFETIEVLFPPRIHGMSNWASNFFGRYKTILGMIRYMRDLGKSEGRL